MLAAGETHRILWRQRRTGHAGVGGPCRVQVLVTPKNTRRIGAPGIMGISRLLVEPGDRRRIKLAGVHDRRLRALTVTSPERIAALQQVPTVVEQGFPGLVIGDWIGFVVRSDAPSDAIDRLNGAINVAIKTSRVQNALAT